MNTYPYFYTIYEIYYDHFYFFLNTLVYSKSNYVTSCVSIKKYVLALAPCAMLLKIGPFKWNSTIDIERPNIDCLSFVMCPLLAQLKIGFFSFIFAAAVYRTNEANKAGLKQSIFLDVYEQHSS